MAALREIFARFGVTFDDRELKQGDAATQAVTASLKTLGSVALGAAGFTGIGAFISSTVAMGDELDKTSQRIGISTDALQAWRFAAGQSGIEGRQLSDALVRLQKRAFEAVNFEMTEAVRIFKELGIETKTAEGELRPLEELLPDVADAVANLGEQERAPALMKLMEESGAALVPLFNQGAEGVQALLAEFEELGGGLTQDAIEQSVELTDQMGRMTLAFRGLGNQLLVAFGPTLLRVGRLLTRLGQQFIRVASDTRTWVAALTVLSPVLVALAFRILPALVRNLVLVALPIVVIVGVLGTLVAAVQSFIVGIEEGNSALFRLVERFNTAVEAIRNGEEVFGGFADSVVLFWGEAVEIVERFISRVVELFGLRTKLKDFFSFLGIAESSAPEFAPSARRGLQGTGGVTASPSELAAARARIAQSTNVTNNITVNGVSDPEAAGRAVNRRLASTADLIPAGS